MLLAVVAMAVSSCSSDDSKPATEPQQDDVTYTLTMDAGLVLNSVTYRKADGNFTTVNNISGSTWTMTVQNVPSGHQANADFEISNPTANNRSANVVVTTPNGGNSASLLIFEGETRTLSVTSN